MECWEVLADNWRKEVWKGVDEELGFQLRQGWIGVVELWLLLASVEDDQSEFQLRQPPPEVVAEWPEPDRKVQED